VFEHDPSAVSDPAPNDLVVLGTVPRALRHRPALILLTTTLGVVIGLLLLTLDLTGRTWTSTSVVQINPGLVGLDSNPLGQGSAVSAESEVQFVLSDPVVALVREQLGTSQSTQQLRSSTRVQAIPDARAISVTFTAGSPERARDGANAFADAYLAARATTLGELLDRSREAIEAQYAEVAAQLESSPAARPGAPQAQLSSYAEQLGRLASVVVDPGVVISRAPLSDESSGLPDFVYPLVGGGVGLLLGGAVAVLRERVNAPIRSVDDLRRLGVPTLGRWVQDGDEVESVGARMALRLRATDHRSVVLSEPVQHPNITPQLCEALRACGLVVIEGSGLEIVSGPSAEPEPEPAAVSAAAERPLDQEGPSASAPPASQTSDCDPLTDPLPAGFIGDGAWPHRSGGVTSGSAELWSPQAPLEPAVGEADRGHGTHHLLGVVAEGPAAAEELSRASLTSDDHGLATESGDPPNYVRIESHLSLLTSSATLVFASEAGSVVLAVDRGTKRRDLEVLLRDLHDGDVSLIGVILV
jgi:capsular polysaccharide biosynthesis protein